MWERRSHLGLNRRRRCPVCGHLASCRGARARQFRAKPAIRRLSRANSRPASRCSKYKGGSTGEGRGQPVPHTYHPPRPFGYAATSEIHRSLGRTGWVKAPINPREAPGRFVRTDSCPYGGRGQSTVRLQPLKPALQADTGWLRDHGPCGQSVNFLIERAWRTKISLRHE